MMDKEKRNIVILGAGVVGLSTALCLQAEFPHFNHTLIADKYNNETLSSGAGGIFRPEINVHPDAEKVRTWCRDSFSHFLKIIQSPECENSGVRKQSGYHLSSTGHSIQNSLVQDLVFEWRKLKKDEFEIFPKHFKNGVKYTTIVADCRYYLPWMKKKFKKAGGKVVHRHIFSLKEVSSDYDIIINCTGLGSKSLCEDDMLTPIRGQTIKVKAPWIKHFYYGDEVYIIPGVDYVTLGGIKDYGSWKTDVNPYQKQYIWHKCTELVPSLKKAEIIQHWVGLRPFRPSIKVETSFIADQNNYKMVIHNYGHGGHGVALSWGTAEEVKRILKKALQKREYIQSKL